MASNPNNRPSQEGSGALPEPLIQQFLQTQHQKALNEAEQIKLRGKELDHNRELSAKYMEIEARLEEKKPSENRKTYTRLGYIGGGILLIILAFIVFCLYLNKEQFVIDLIRYGLYPVLTGAGYYVGRKSKNKKLKSEKFDEAEILRD